MCCFHSLTRWPHVGRTTFLVCHRPSARNSVFQPFQSKATWACAGPKTGRDLQMPGLMYRVFALQYRRSAFHAQASQHPLQSWLESWVVRIGVQSSAQKPIATTLKIIMLWYNSSSAAFRHIEARTFFPEHIQLSCQTRRVGCWGLMVQGCRCV